MPTTEQSRWNPRSTDFSARLRIGSVEALSPGFISMSFRLESLNFDVRRLRTFIFGSLTLYTTSHVKLGFTNLESSVFILWICVVKLVYIIFFRTKVHTYKWNFAKCGSGLIWNLSFLVKCGIWSQEKVKSISLKLIIFQHHIHTNDVNLDPDIAIEFYVRLNPTHPLLKFQPFQYFYFFIIIAFYGLVKVYLSMGKIGKQNSNNRRPMK